MTPERGARPRYLCPFGHEVVDNDGIWMHREFEGDECWTALNWPPEWELDAMRRRLPFETAGGE